MAEQCSLAGCHGFAYAHCVRCRQWFCRDHLQLEAGTGYSFCRCEDCARWHRRVFSGLPSAALASTVIAAAAIASVLLVLTFGIAGVVGAIGIGLSTLASIVWLRERFW